MEELLENLIPLYNKEFYLAYLCGEDVALPIPDGNAERYLAYLCGMDVTIPDVPDGRTETYLAYKCGEDVVLPDPMYRIEFYLAKWCGIDCEVPEPLYRIEYWLAQLANSGELKTVTGNPISISDALAKPAEALSIEILPYQSGSGDPSPDNVRPITGWTEANVWRTGKNLYLIDATHTGKPSGYVGNWESVTIVGNGNGFTARKKAADGGFGGIWAFGKAGTYTISYDVDLTNATGSAGNIKWAQVGASTNTTLRDITSNTETHREFTVTAPSDGILMFRPCASNWETNATHEITFTNVQLELGSHATAYEPYNGNTYTIDWTDEAGTVYGGSLNVTTGVLTVDRAIVDLGTLNWAYFTNNKRFVVTLANGKPTGTGFGGYGICSSYPVSQGGYGALEDNTLSVGSNFISGSTCSIVVHDETYTDASTFKTAMSGVQLVYELATPQTIQLTATQVEMLLGNNVLWNDVDGDMTLEYLADGPAEDIDALNILLNNRYMNNGEPDEATDKEALEILLGGNTR